MATQPKGLILRNARVWTGDAARPWAHAIGVAGERVAAVGDETQVRTALDQGAEELDLAGKLVVPGFIDSHVHLLKGGEQLTGLDLRAAGSPAEFAERVRAALAARQEGGWFTSGRWDNTRWPGGAWPHRDLIDEISRGVPVFLQRADGHMALVNETALRIAGIGPDTPDPPGGAIDRDERGRPTGLLRDAAMRLVWDHVPKPDEREKETWLRSALRHAAALGVTSLDDMDGAAHAEVYRKLRDGDELTCRVSCWAPLEQLDEAAMRAWPPDDRLRFAGAKGFADGSLGSRTALMFAPFADGPGNCGLASAALSDGGLERRLVAADAARPRGAMAVHAIGDKANALVLDIVERLPQRNGDRRFRIEHAQHLRREDLARIARLGVIASVQPAHVLLDAPAVDRALGPERGRWSYPFRSLLDAGARLCFGSDWPVVGLNPLDSLCAAVCRQPPDGSYPDGWFPEERLTVEQALRCHTLGGAFAQFREGDLGSIAPGKLADLVALSDDIFALEPKAIGRVRVELTLVSGRTVHRAR